MNNPDFTKPAPDFTRALQTITGRIRSARVVANAMIDGEQAKKAIEMSDSKVLIKGLSEAMAEAKKSIALARAAPAALKESATALVATCKELKDQVDQMHSDIKFEATELGNAGSSSATE